MQELKQILKEYENVLANIQRVLEKSGDLQNNVNSSNLRIDMIREEINKIQNVIFGDNNNDPIQVKIKVLEKKVQIIEDSLENIHEEYKKNIQEEKTKYNKIILTILGLISTIITTILGYFLDFKKN